ncbi:MAG TPA: hypothetical protein VEH09_00410, partial [Thermodesulfobacteriota bacterium]|nr:hypothetical protein [Thermodesulfobacteriota bacterium]
MTIKALSGKFWGWFIRMLSSSRTSFSLFMFLLALTITYRIMLTVGLFTNPIRPFDFSPGSHPVRFTVTYWYHDLGLVLACSLLTWILSRGGYFLKGRRESLLFKIMGLISLHLILVGLLFV